MHLIEFNLYIIVMFAIMHVIIKPIYKKVLSYFKREGFI